MSSRRVATAAGLLLLLALTLWYAGRTPAPVAASAPATEFSTERALQHVREITRGPHPVSSAEHDRVRDYVSQTLASYGAEVEIQQGTGVGTRYAVAGRIANVIGRVPGRQRGGPYVLLASHYDGVPGGPAAGDDAAATAGLLETVRALRAGPPLQHDVMILVTDAEEAGLLGAAAFVRDHPAAKDAGIIINFEARGDRGPSLMFETGRGNLDAVRVLRGIGGARASSLSTAVYRRLPNDTDLSEFALLDKPALNFAFIGGVNRYHTAQDDLEHLNQGSLQQHGQQALELARAFGNAELPRPVTSDAVFFDLPLIGVVLYPEAWSVGFALLAVGLVALATLRSRRPETRLLRDIAVGALTMVLTLVVAGVLGWALSRCLDRLHDAFASGEPMWSIVYAAAIAMAVVTLTAAAYRMVRRWASAPAVRLAALWLWTALSVALVLAAPGASFLLLWPVIAASAAMLAETFLRRQGILARAPAWGAAAIILSFLAPTTYLMVCLALGIATMGVVILSVLTALTTWLLSPQLETMSSTAPNAGGTASTLDWRFAATAAAMTFALIVLGATTVRTTLDDPAGAQIHYVVEADSNRAWLTGSGTTIGADQWIVRSVRRIAGNKPAPVGGWMRQRLDSTRSAQVPYVALPAPSVTLLSDSAAPDARRVVLRVRPGPASGKTPVQAYLMQMSMPREAVTAAVVDGKAIDVSRYRAQSRYWRLDYVAPPDSGFTVALTLKSNAKRELDVGTRFLTIPPLGTVPLPQRPPGVVTYQGGNFSTTYRRIAF